MLAKVGRGTFGEHGVRWVGGIWVVKDLVLGLFRDDEGGPSVQVFRHELDDGFNERLPSLVCSLMRRCLE